ncbi:MAG: ABC transporter permease [Proteobacteria bacterium]|nr:ABC transporter permease [Pseudomonadota bacterium]
MQIGPILATLRCHKLTSLLLMLQVAFTCAIVCNVAFMVANREHRIHQSSGIVENELSVIGSNTLVNKKNFHVQHAADLIALRAIPGVKSAAAVSYSLPLDQSEWSTGICPSLQALERAKQLNSMNGTACIEPSVYDGTSGLIETLGLQMLEGRDFLPEEYVIGQKDPSVAIVTRTLAQRFYPGEDALGKVLYNGGNKPIRIVGVVSDLLRPNLHAGSNYDSMIFPLLPDSSNVMFLLRSAPQDRAAIMQVARATLRKNDPDGLIGAKSMQTYAQIRSDYFQRDTTMIGLLIASALGLLFVTALGITGLASFWVQQRTRSIGVRRALGATRRDILGYFQTENFLIVTFGIVPGIVLAVAINLTLMKFYELPRLPFFYLPVGALALWALGQLAVLHPALRAAAVPPVVATRTV